MLAERIIAWSLALALSFYPPLASAQLRSRGFPPGTFQSRGAIDPPACTPTSPPSGGIYDNATLNGGWISNAQQATLTDNSVTSPDCALNGATLVEDNTNNQHNTLDGVIFSVTVISHTFSVYAKRGVGSRNIEIGELTSGFSNIIEVIVNLATCSAGTPSGSGTLKSATATLQANGWCFITATATPLSTDTKMNLYIFMVSGASTISYAGDGTSSLNLWGVDLR